MVLFMASAQSAIHAPVQTLAMPLGFIVAMTPTSSTSPTQTVLLSAAQAGDLETVQNIVNAGGTPVEYLAAAALCAMENKYPEITQWILFASGQGSTIPADSLGAIFLSVAVNGAIDLVQLFVSSGLINDFPIDFLGQTLLAVVQKGLPEVLTALLQIARTQDLSEEYRHASATLAAIQGNLQIMTTLVESSLISNDVIFKDTLATAQKLAEQNNHPDISSYLSEKMALL